MLSSAEIAKRIQAFHTVEDVVSAMKAYAGVTVRKTEEIVPHIREYEKNMLSAVADMVTHYGAGFLEERRKGKRIVAAFGSSVGLCGAFNEKMADAVSNLFTPGDVLLVVGRRLKSSLDLKHIPYRDYGDSVISINGINAALRDTLSKIMDIYGKDGYYDLTFVFTCVIEKGAEILVERILPPAIDDIPSVKSPPLTYMMPHVILDHILEEFIYISLYRCYVESLRSENWYRLRSMEGASESLRKHISELASLQRYIGQEEITEEMIEILGSGMFYGT
ncbi:MAG: F0F1 ATP synthase subunit gamma [Candidatus Sulfobium sp.]|jgi:F-type H+-transporting ATPase subunit gamma